MAQQELLSLFGDQELRLPVHAAPVNLEPIRPDQVGRSNEIFLRV